MTEISTAEVAQFRNSARAAFGGDHGTERARTLMATPTGWEPEGWRRIAADLGVVGLMLPDEVGGTGLTASESAYVFEEAGRALVGSPLLGTAGLAVPLLLELKDEDALQMWGHRLASGEVTATVAIGETSGVWATDRIETRAESGPGGWVLQGTKEFVVDGLSADIVLVAARHAGGLGVFAVENLEAERRTALVTLDQTRRLARLDLAGVNAMAVGPADATAPLATAAAIARSLLAAEQTGGAQRCLDMAVAYAKTRFQFARPIGTFQAVKQRLADVLIEVESARSAAYAAARAAASDDPDLEVISRIAAVTASEAFLHAAGQNIQLHGGIGFTWEHDAHLFYKRARSTAILLGTESEHLSALAQALESAAI